MLNKISSSISTALTSATTSIKSNDATAIEKSVTLIKNLIKVVGSVAAGSTIIGFLRYLVFAINYRLAQSRSKLPLSPGPLPLPIIGSIQLLLKYPGPDGNPLVHIALMEEGKKYNGIFGLYLGSAYTVVITKPSIAEEAYMEHPLANGYEPRGSLTTDRCSNQSHGGHHVPTMKLFTRDGQGIAMSTGSYWRKVRGRLVANITAPAIARQNEYLVREEVESVIWNWRMKCLRQEKIDDLTAQLKRESMNMGMRLLFSIRYGADIPKDCEIIKHCVEYCFQHLSSGNPSDLIPILRVLPNKFLDDFKKVVDLRDEVFGRIIAQHRKEFNELRASGKIKGREDARDICDLFFFDQDIGFENSEGKTIFLTEDEVHVSLFDIIFAMTDTTATTNEWMIYHLINNPDIQEKVHAELDSVIGPDRLPVLGDKEKLPYFWMFLKEVFRFRIVSPVMAPHYAVEDITLHDTKGKEFFIPRGTSIFMHGYSMGLDPEFWKEPEKFNPDRWLEPENVDLDVPGQVKRASTDHYKFMPFSIGPRMCPGYSFAKVAQFIQSATIAHCFRFKLDPQANYTKYVKNGKLDLTETWGLTIMPQRFGELGLIAADPRPASRLAKPKVGDINYNNPFLNKQRKSAKVIHRERLSPDTILIRFGLESRSQVLGLPIGKHFKIYMPNIAGKEPGKWNGRDDPTASSKEVERAYTPTSCDENVGCVDLVVKVYEKGANLKFPDGGKVSQQLGKLIVGDVVDINGPFGRIEYLGCSQFSINRVEMTKKMVGMIAGGSGITPIYQVLKKALEDENDKTKFCLIYANQTESDILLRDQLEDFSARFPNRFWLHYTLDRPSPGWKYSTGFVDEAMLKSKMPPPGPETIILACGPTPMIDFAIKPNLEKLGYGKDDLAAF